MIRKLLMWQLSVIEVMRTVNDISFFTLLFGYKQLLEHPNQLITLKQEFGNRPVWPTTQNAEAKTVPTLDGSRTFVSTGYWREGLIKFQISNGPPSFYVLLYILRSLCYCQLIISNQAFPIVMDAYVVYARRNSCGIMANEQNIGAKEERDVI